MAEIRENARALDYGSSMHRPIRRVLPIGSLLVAVAGVLILQWYRLFGGDIFHADDRSGYHTGCIAGAVCGAVAIGMGVAGILRSKRGDARRILAAIGVLIGILLVVFLPIWLARDIAGSCWLVKFQRDHSNIVEIGIACYEYAQSDPHGRYPPDLATLFLSQGPSADCFVSPFSNDTPAPGQTAAQQASNLLAGGHESYVYVGAGLSDKAPADEVLLFEPPAKTQAHDLPVVFADGDVHLEPSSDVEQMLKMYQAGVHPIYWPPRSATQPSVRP